jgi:molecular chaperone GrpE
MPNEEIINETEILEQEQETPVEAEEEIIEKSEIELMAEKMAELNENYLRLRAEYDNFRKRSQKEREEIYPAATVSALAKFLPVFDNIERAAAFPHGDDEFGKGFDLIHQSLGETLKSMGVEIIAGEGEPFDPGLHHAVMHIEDESLGENVVAAVLQKGYKLGERVVRYAMVQTAN